MTNTRKLMSASIATLLLMSMALSIVAYAQPPAAPMAVYGYVHIDTDGVLELAPAGIIVYAKEDETVFDESTTNADGFYYFALTGPEEDASIGLWIDDTLVATVIQHYMSDPVVLNLTITGDAPPANVAPVADANGPYTGEVDEAIIFDGSGSSDSDGTIVSYAWTFGDGGTATVESPSHTYTVADLYTVTLTVTDDDGATGSDTAGVAVIEVVAQEGFSIDYVSADVVDYADVLTVSGSGVTAGTEVKIFWDYAHGTLAHLLNTTEGKPAGTFECEIDVPSDTVGDHYIWATDTATGETISWGPIEMVPRIKLSPSSGLVGDDVTINGYGFTAEANFTFTFGAELLTTSPTKVESDEDGYFKCTFEVPEDIEYDDYMVEAEDFYGFSDDAKFVLGASITLSLDEGPTGSLVTVEGRGWSPKNLTTFSMAGIPIEVVDDDDDAVEVTSKGLFSAKLIIPDVGSTGEYLLVATGIGTGIVGPADADFDVDGVPKFTVSPTYGTPGATITVKGYNFTQIAKTEVEVKIGTDILVTAETKSDGTFEDTFISPAITFQTYTVTATDEYLLDADDTFKVGLIALIINPIYGEAGTKVSITGIGFAEGVYNVTFGTKLYEEYGTVTSGEAISDLFYVPNVETGIYDVTIIDTDENELTVQFTLTAISKVVLDPSVAPNEYNVSVKGYNFADVKYGAVEFVLYNVTADGELDKEWDMDVWENGAGTDPAETTVDGNFTAWWEVLEKDELSIGDYTVNITGSKGLLVQVPFSVVAARVDIAPRKAQFDRGDRVQFNIKNDFKLAGSYIEIYDPYDTLYWKTEAFEDDWWLLVEGLYTVPYYRQTAAGNPMELQSDALMGAWLYIFYDVDDDQLMNGTFAVGPSTEAQVDLKLTEIWGSIEDLTENIDGITDELEDDIAALSGEIDDIVADIEDKIDDITGDIADDLAQVAEDTEAAVSDLEGSIGDLAAAQNEMASDIVASKQESTAAKEAAEDAQTGVQGLSTLVYGAIGASLIAALAAIVSLMQISKKIA